MIVDDHPVVREGIKTYLSNHDSIEVVAEAQDGDTAIEIFPGFMPDVVLMDLMMPGTSGIYTTEIIMNRWPRTKIIALTSFVDRQLIEKTIKAGAIGYLLKNISGEKLASAIVEAMKGKATLSSETSGYILTFLKENNPYGKLTKREKEVLSFIATGLSNDEIAGKLVVSPNTVKFHVGNILNKLNVRNRTEAIAVAQKENLL
ncbi:MAG: response regulator transcription factor [Actinobacteria bacterium]|nr:response regulator transcription factor [Actinomycetota bacterium]